MKHHAYVAHHVAGRLRIKIPSANGNPALLDQVKKQLFGGIPGVERVTTKPHSGSLVLNYDPRLEEAMEARFRDYQRGRASLQRELVGDEIGALASRIEAEGEYLARNSDWAKAIVDFFKQLDRGIKLSTNNAIDLKIVIAVSLAVFTFVEIGGHAATPMWVTLALFALHEFIEMHPPGVAFAVPA